MRRGSGDGKVSATHGASVDSGWCRVQAAAIRSRAWDPLLQATAFKGSSLSAEADVTATESRSRTA